MSDGYDSLVLGRDGNAARGSAFRTSLTLSQT